MNARKNATLELRARSRRLVVGMGFALVSAMAWAGCGSDSDSGDTRGAGGNDVDASSGGSTSGTGGVSNGGSGGTGGAAQDCSACAPGQVCVNGQCSCAAYQSLCNGACIPTTMDPANCGDCGQTCAAGSVCSGGGCVGSCLPGLTACDGACFDVLTSNDHCGDCGMPCGANEGCVDGNCMPALVFDAPGDMCAGGGAPISIGSGSTATCLGDLAQTTFTWALCSCTDVTSSTTLFVDGFDSSEGPYEPGQLGGGVGVNGSFRASHETDIWGTLWASGNVTTSFPAQVHNELHAGGSVDVNDFVVGNDAYIAGDSTGDLAITGTLTTPDGASLGANVTSGTLVRAPVTVAEPCNCEPAEIIPVADIVAAHATDNDNALIGLDPDALNQADRPARIDLPCGEYYFSGISGGGPLTIAVHGRTAIYIDGDVVNSTFLAFVLDPGAELDVFISGTLTTSNDLVIGSPNYPAATRVYVGGSDVVRFSANAQLAGNFYAANAQVIWTSTSEAYGSVFAGEFTASAPTNIHYDRQVVTTGDEECGGPVPPGDAGTTPPPSCGTCTDCNNQACVNGQCGQCSSNADCCAPLECGNGFCFSPVR